MYGHLLYPWVPPSQIQPTKDGKYLGKKIPESFKKQNLNLPHSSNYVHSIYIIYNYLCTMYAVRGILETI